MNKVNNYLFMQISNDYNYFIIVLVIIYFNTFIYIYESINLINCFKKM